MSRYWIGLALLLLTLIFSQPSAHAQSTFGAVIGVVKDPKGLVIPGAKITLLNVEEHSSRDEVSNADGEFQFMNVKPGRYEVTAIADGFATFKLESLQLEARQTLRADFSLKVKSASETIEVGDTAPMINTESATLADTKDFLQVSQLPVNYRGATTSSMAVLDTVPGAQQDANGNVAIGGGLPSQVQYSVDGASTVNIRQNGALGNMNPSSELISEFRVSQFNNNAEFAQLGDVTIATKSGTDHFHGSLFEYLQNSLLDATPYNLPLKPHKAFNTFGGSLGGPLKIPGLLTKNSHTFFFVAYEGNRRRLTTPLFLSVPTAAMRVGNLNDPNFIGKNSIVVNPLTGQPFPSNTVACNPDCINPAATSLFGMLPSPTSPNASVNYLQQTPTPSNTDGYDVRIDHILTAKQSIYGRWSAKSIASTIPNQLLPSDSDNETDHNLILSHNYAITNTLVNEARFGLSLFRIGVNFSIEGATAIQQLGLTGLDISDHPTASAFPTFNFSDTGLTPIGRDKTGVTKSQTIQFTDNLGWARGKHSMKFGVDIRRVAYADIESFGGSDDFGAFTFSGGALTGLPACSPTLATPTLCESSFADLLLGLPAKTYTAQSGPDVLAHTVQTGVYGQDEWHVNRRLTLTFGLRWQALPPFVSPLNNLTAFDKRNGGVIVPDANVPRQGFLESINACAGPYNPYGVANPSLACGPVESASSQGLGPGVREFYKHNFQPRVGFAFRPFGDEKTVVRGGFGIFTMTNLGQLSFNTTNISVGVVRTTANSVQNGTPAYQFPNVTTPVTAPALAGTGDFYQNTPINYRDPQSAQWNLTVERELVRDTTLRVSYVGTNSYRMSQTVDLNQLPPSTVSPNPNQKPYMNWGRILSSENEGSVNYEGLQSELNHRTRGGLTLQASHVWAKSLGNVGGDAPTAFSPEVIYGTPVANRFDLAANRGNVAAVRRQRFLVSSIYELPFGNGRHFFNHMSAVPQTILGGWSLSMIALWQTGPYLTPITSPTYDPGNLNLVYRGAYQRPDCIGNGNLSNPTPADYFNLAAFVAQPSGPVGNCRIGSLVGPGTVAIAGGLSKTFSISESVRLKFESTFTNILNHSNYAPPSTDVTSSTFGQITGVQSAENAGNRTGQVALRLEF